MNGVARLRAGISAGAAAIACAIAAPAPAQAPAGQALAAASASHVVKRGETLYAIARRYRPAGVTLNQMLVALFRSNPDAFENQDANHLKVGATMAIPGRATVAAVDPAEAVRAVQSWRARPAVPPPPPVKEAAPAPLPPKPVPRPAPAAKLTPEEAEARYQAGLAFERSGNDRGALQAFTDAGESGHGHAQKRLGEIYDKGNSVVTRDYDAALRWYQKARAQGVAIPKPIRLPSGH